MTTRQGWVLPWMTQRVPAPHWVEAVQVLPAVLLVQRKPAWLSGATATRQVPCTPATEPHWLPAARQFWEASGSCTGGGVVVVVGGGCTTTGAGVVVVGGFTTIGGWTTPLPPLRRLAERLPLLWELLPWLLA